MRVRAPASLAAFALLAGACFLGPAPTRSAGGDGPVPLDLAPPGLAQACPEAREQELPLPSSIAAAGFVEFEKQVLRFLQAGGYKTLRWCEDKSVRDTGPYRGHVYYGSHPAVRIFYSPKVMAWLLRGRAGAIPDGGMIIKEQYPPPAGRYAAMGDDALPKVIDWTIMIRDSKGSHDGWFWGEFFDGMRFDDDKAPYQYPWAGTGLYCLRCHATAQSELTFSDLGNIKGYPGKPIAFSDDQSWRVPTTSARPSTITTIAAARAGPAEVAEFRRTFAPNPGLRIADVTPMLPETFDNVSAPAGHRGAFISSSQCMSCHGGLDAPFGPTMLLTGKTSPANVSPYGEWRWSPMGLAGRDPMFFAQLESESAFFDTLGPKRGPEVTTQITNACMRCHGAMGKRQLDADSSGPDRHGTGDFKLSYLKIANRDDPHFKYGALARDGISCEICHRNAADAAPPGVSSLGHFLTHSITGRFATTPPDRLLGPFKDDEIAPYAMVTGIGVKPVYGDYIKSSRMCGGCHTIDLPVVDSPTPGRMAIEQATYLEWLNSQYQTEFGARGPNARSCVDCHMPGDYHSPEKGIDVAHIQDKIAIIADQTYPEAEHQAATRDITVRTRNEGFARHAFQGLNVFLLEMFDQFGDLLGVRRDDYMSGSKTDLDDVIASYLRQASTASAGVTMSSRVAGQRQIEARVAITNWTGHRLPSGVGFRRMFVELLVTDQAGKVVWGSGRTNGVGVIVDGEGRPLPSEFFADYRDARGRLKQRYQPHHERIDRQDQAQIYEELGQDAAGRFTTNFTRRDKEIKDNRLPPIGWTHAGPDPSLNGRWLEATHPKGEAAGDPDYQDGHAGTDHLTYAITLPAGVDPARCHVKATLYYQSIPPYYLNQRFAAAPAGEATRRLYYLTSNLDPAGSSSGPPVAKDWKLPLVSTGFIAPIRGD